MLSDPAIEVREGVRLPAAVLSLDLGANLGWAVRLPDGRTFHGMKSFPAVGGDEHYGRRHYLFKRWLTEIKNQYDGVFHVVYEVINFGRNNPRIIHNQEGILLAWCEHHGMSYKGYAPGTIKKHVTGSGRADKAEVIAAVRDMGFSPCSDHTADAIACLSLGCSELRAC